VAAGLGDLGVFVVLDVIGAKPRVVVEQVDVAVGVVDSADLAFWSPPPAPGRTGFAWLEGAGFATACARNAEGEVALTNRKARTNQSAVVRRNRGKSAIAIASVRSKEYARKKHSEPNTRIQGSQRTAGSQMG
jgi:hypothetical protein